MSTVVIQDRFRIPDSVRDLDSFCRWACSDEYPERGRYSFLNGEVWVDMSPENFYTHNQVKGEIAAVLATFAKKARLGRYVHDRMLVRNDKGNLSTEPDGAFISTATLRSGRIEVERITAGYDILVGIPDMVLEVVSDSSERKDTEILRELYGQAGIPEYWLVDPRGEELVFDILHHRRSGYVAARKQAGWQKSKVFGKFFRLTVEPDELGNPEYTLRVR
jgi:Uma2 family endonuclease